MQIKNLTIDQLEREYLLYYERESKPFAPRKSWDWRRKFAFILDIEELRRETAVQCAPSSEIIDIERLVELRRALAEMRRLFTTPGIGYHELLRVAEARLEASRGREHLAFIALFERLVFRLRHLDARL